MVNGSVVITGARSGRPNPERFAASCAAASPNTWPSGMGNCAKSTAAAKKDSSEESMVYWLKSPPNLRLCLPRVEAQIVDELHAPLRCFRRRFELFRNCQCRQPGSVVRMGLRGHWRVAKGLEAEFI